MILCDPRTGSAELLGNVLSLRVPAQLSTVQMPAGDFCFEGNGPDGTILIGIERKTVRDMMNCIRSGRFSGDQLKELVDMYQRYYIIVEGIHRAGRDGILEGLTRQGNQSVWAPIQTGSIRYMYAELDKFLISLEEFSPLQVHYTQDKQSTAVKIVNLYHYWTDKLYSEHRAIDGVHKPHIFETISPWPLVRRFASELPGVGAESSRMIGEQIASTPQWQSLATLDWSNMEMPRGKGTRKVGDKLAVRIEEDILKG